MKLMIASAVTFATIFTGGALLAHAAAGAAHNIQQRQQQETSVR